MPFSPAPIPVNEASRLAALYSYDILDTPPEPSFDAYTRLASRIFGVPMAQISLIDRDRNWPKSSVGLPLAAFSRDLSFCSHAILDPAHAMVVNDACADQRFAENPLVLGDPRIRFYAGAPLRDANGAALGVLCVLDAEPRAPTAEMIESLEDLARGVVAALELHRNALRLDRLASTDLLTGLANRATFERRLDKAVRDALWRGADCAVVALDLDRFKAINDLFGHAGGDALLRHVAGRLSGALRGGDLLARLSGDEFAVLLPGPLRRGEGAALAQRLLDTLAVPFSLDGRAVVVRASAGVAMAPAHAQTNQGLMERADAALYYAKHQGRARVQLYDPAMAQALDESRSLILDRDRLAEDEWVLTLDPVAAARGGGVVGCRAAASLPDTTRRLGADAMERRDRWLLAEVCRTATRLMHPGPQLATPAGFVSVSLHAGWLDRHDALAELVMDSLAQGCITPRMLQIDILGAAPAGPQAGRNASGPGPLARRSIDQIRALGVRVGLAGFGGPGMGLEWLAFQRFDKVEIDPLLIATLGHNARGEEVVRSILALGSTLGVRVCAAGVDSADQMIFLRDNGCAEFRGRMVGAGQRPSFASDAAPDSTAPDRGFGEVAAGYSGQNVVSGSGTLR